MKDNFFEMLMHLFEKSLTQLQKQYQTTDKDSSLDEDALYQEEASIYVKAPQTHSLRVFTYNEQMKLTKASYQFLMRMKLWKVLDTDLFEMVLHQLASSESRVVTLEETKWCIRNTMAPALSEEQLAFLDLILYQAEDAFAVH